MTDNPNVRIEAAETLYQGWATLTSFRIDYRRRDGAWDAQTRIVLDIGDAAAVLPYDAQRGTVLLVRQFRLPAHLAGRTEPLIEVCAGKLDADDPETCVRREAEEELGYRLGRLDLSFEAFMSPGAVTERITLFLAPYSPTDQVSAGGGHPSEGEDIEVLELAFAEALAMAGRGQIVDAKTILLLQHLQLSGRMGA